MKYVTYDYEEPYPVPDKRNYWHIYSTDEADHDVFDESTLVCIYALMTQEMEARIIAICEAIDAAVETAQQQSAGAPK